MFWTQLCLTGLGRGKGDWTRAAEGSWGRGGGVLSSRSDFPLSLSSECETNLSKDCSVEPGASQMQSAPAITTA